MRNAVLLSILMVAFALSGCAMAGPEGETEALAEGVTVLEAEAGALSLAYRSGDTVIYMQALRGRATGPEYRGDESFPLFEIDARVTDAQGYVFYSQQGGDGWLEPAWAEDLERQIEDRPRQASNGALFRLAGEAGEELREAVADQLGAERAAAFEPELRSLLAFTTRAVETYEEELERAQQARLEVGLPPIEVGELGELAEVPYGSDTGGPDDPVRTFGAGYYYIAVHDAAISATLGLGRHSSTALYRWQNGGWLHAHNSCNHGRCGTEMAQKCLLQYYESATDYHPEWRLRSCATEYDMFSDGGGHNCHDDSRVQMHNFVYNSAVDSNEFWCNGNDDSTDISSWPGDQSGSPTCDPGGNSGYHHRPLMCDYNHSSSCPASWQGTDDGCDCGCTFPDGTGADPDCG